MDKTNKRIRLDINKVIADEVKRLNGLFQKGAKISKKDIKPFAIDDYKFLKESQDYFGTFTVPYFLTYSVFKDVENRIQNPYPGTIWYWEKDADESKTKTFLPAQTKLLHDTLNSYMALLKTENFLQALILFRSYIEYSSQLYASLLDYEFFKKYTGSGMMEEEYKKLWFSSLKPAKVLATIKTMHSEINSLLKEKKIDYAGNAVYRRIFHPFDSEMRGYLYGTLSGLAHGSHSYVTKHDDVKLYALVWLCTTYLVESQVVIDELTSVYFNYTPKELFNKWITVEVYMKSREPKTEIFLADT